jgi:hypothetical protein
LGKEKDVEWRESTTTHKGRRWREEADEDSWGVGGACGNEKCSARQLAWIFLSTRGKTFYAGNIFGCLLEQPFWPPASKKYKEHIETRIHKKYPLALSAP